MTTRPRAAWAAALLSALLLLGACSDDDGSSGDSDATTAADDGDTATTGADEADTGGEAAAGEVDVCSLLSADDVSEATGEDFSEGQPLEARGSLLGGCDFPSEDASLFVSVSARPADEYETTVEGAGNQEDVDGVGEEAAWTDAGLLVLFDDYMLHVQAISEGEFDQDASVAVAQAIDA